ncbi:hypothetical protein F8M41_016670 [Gigaspora margarita]|uniref:Uncharacterized protein n=1 Tax=Gigaspora margarita TaxID=4874 RepID=A0A8H3ZV57_GIGMA|nr:hypothetical protein F8M41_016670 [Gigaspora margarita]
MCPTTYEEAKDLALIVEPEFDNEIVQANKNKSCNNKLDDIGHKIGQMNIKKKNIPEVKIRNTFWNDLESEVDQLLLVIRDGENCKCITEKNYRKAHIYYQIPAKIDHDNGTYNLGNCDQDGISLENNEQ